MPSSLECTFSSPLSEDTISDILDGQADEDALKHLQGCEFCRNRVQQAGEFELSLRSKMHPSALQLGEYQLGYLDATEAGKIRNHLAVCFRCREELQTLNTFLTVENSKKTAATPVTSKQRTQPGSRMVIREGQMAAAVRFSAPEGAARPHII